MKTGLAILAVAAGVCAVCACSSSPSGPNVDSQKLLSALSVSEQGTLCDWKAAKYGGYGKEISCGGGLTFSMKAPSDQPTCVTTLPKAGGSCKATVGQFETCVQWMVQNGCGSGTQPAECADIRGSGCM